MNLLKKFFSFSIGSYISLVIGFFSLPIITRIISPEQYGVFSFFLLIVNLGSLLLLLGLDQGFVRFFYEEKNKSELLYKCLKFPFLLWLMASLIIYIFKEKVSFLIYNEKNYGMLLILIIILFFSILRTFSFLVVRLNKDGFKYSILQILDQGLNFLFIILLYKFYNNSYKVLVIAYFLSISLTLILSIIFEKNIWKKVKGKNKSIQTLDILKYSLPFILTFSLSWIFNSSDKIIIKHYSSLNELGLYSMSFTIIKLFNIVQTGFTLFWVPIAYEKYSQEPENKIFFNEIFNNISFIMLLLAIVVLIIKDIIVLFLGKNYYLTSQIIPCLVFMPVMYTISETTVLGINFSKKTKYHILISMTVAIFNILGNIILVSRFGAKGAAISTGIAYILFFSLRTYFAKKLIDYNFKLKRLYCISILILIYSLYLSFYNKIILNIIFGMLLLVLHCFLYFREIKLIYNYLFQYYFDLKKPEGKES